VIRIDVEDTWAFLLVSLRGLSLGIPSDPSRHGRSLEPEEIPKQVVWPTIKLKHSKRRLDMYVTVRRYEGVTDPAEAGRRVNEGFLAIISKVPGFVAYYWVDAGSGVMISTSVFQDQSGEEESNKLAADYVREKMASLLPKPPQITAGEVIAHKAK
jgi:hypothetical protein